MKDIISIGMEILAILFWFTTWVVGIGTYIAGGGLLLAVMGFLGLLITPAIIAWFRHERQARRSLMKKEKKGE